MTTALTRQTIKFPYAEAHDLLPWGGKIGARVPSDKQLVHVTLPDGWSTDWGTRHGVPGALRDQHGRLRATIRWTMHMGRDGNYYDTLDGAHFSQPDSHARDVAEHGAPLVLDTWAQPHLMIGTAAERVGAFHNLIHCAVTGIDRWRDEQPEHAAKLDADRQGYEKKLAAWTELLDRLADEIRNGWTVRNASARTELTTPLEVHQ
ncbi:hypothetical protein ACWDSL_06655 [Streptomyces sp. NPDC000941]